MWKGVFRLNPVAIKTCRITKVTARVVREFMGELKLMAPLSHSNLVSLVGGCWSDGPDKLCLVLEFCARGTLKDVLVATATHELNHDWSHPFFKITMGIASCFRYFHHEQPSGEALLHRDLKPENVLISDTFEAKVRDDGALDGVSKHYAAVDSHICARCPSHRLRTSERADASMKTRLRAGLRTTKAPACFQ